MKASERAEQMKAYDTAPDNSSDHERFCEGWDAGKAYRDRQFERLMKAAEAYYLKRKSVDDSNELEELRAALREVKGQ